MRVSGRAESGRRPQSVERGPEEDCSSCDPDVLGRDVAGDVVVETPGEVTSISSDKPKAELNASSIARSCSGLIL